MNISLIPQPKALRTSSGFLDIPDAGAVFVGDGMFRDAADEICAFLNGYRVVSSPSSRAFVSVVRGASLRPGGYRLKIHKGGIIIEAESAKGAFWGAQTLRQIGPQGRGRRLPLVDINDWPDFEVRGVYYDVTRGRVPKTERLLELAEKLSHYKINQLQLYIEHTFLFHGHPEIGKNASPLTSGDILDLDEFCRDRYIELVPSLACFGHLSTVLSLPRYRHLAEDWGVGKYVSPDAGKLPEWQKRIAWSLSPANPESYVFLDSLFEEFLPLFSSDKFNICCDETWDLGLGQSFELCKRRGKGRVYLDHILKLRDLAAKYGKNVMFWGDIIRKYPELHRKIPKDVTLLDWGYDHNHPFARVKDFKKAGLKFYVCPGTGSWNSLFPRLPEAMANIHGFAAAGKWGPSRSVATECPRAERPGHLAASPAKLAEQGASGLLNTDWGDGGHYNFMEFSWPGYLFGAEQGWNVKADAESFVGRFCHVFMNSGSADLSGALVAFGDIAQLQVRKNRSIWQEIFFAAPGDEVFASGIKDCWVSKNGKISARRVSLSAILAGKTIAKLERIRRVFVQHSGKKSEDYLKILPYWIFAVDTMIHSARKLAVLGHGGRDTRANRRVLRTELKQLMARFKSLWLARNRSSEINITIDKYRKVARAL